MSTEKVAQLTFQNTEFNSACIVCLCGSERVCAWSERVCACVGCGFVSVCVCVWRGAPVIMSCCFSMEQLCEPPAASKQGTDCLATVLSLANFPPPPTNRAGHSRGSAGGGGEKHNREKERTERLVRKFAVKKHEKSWRDISSCFQQRVIRRRKQNDSYILIILRRQHFLKL